MPLYIWTILIGRIGLMLTIGMAVMKLLPIQPPFLHGVLTYAIPYGIDRILCTLADKRGWFEAIVDRFDPDVRAIDQMLERLKRND